MKKIKCFKKIKDFLSRNNKKIKIGLFSSLAVGITAFAITNSISNVNASSGINVDNGYRNISLSSNITSSSQYTKVSKLDTTDKAIYNYLANNQIYVNNNYTIDSSKKDICYWRQDNDYGRVTNIQKYKIFDEVPVNTYWEVSIQFRNSYTSSATTTLNNNVLQYNSTSTTYFSDENPNYGYSILFYYLNEDGSINPIEGYGLKLAGSPKLTYCNTQQHTFYRFYEKNLYVAINIGLSTIYNVGYEDITSSIQLTLIPYSYDSSFNNVNYNIDYYNNIQEQVETLYNENETNKATIESLNNQITTLNSQIETLNNQVTSLNSQIDALNNTITEKDKSIATKDLKILSLNNEVIKLQNQITTLQNQISTLQTEYNETYNKLQLIEQTSTTILDSPFYNSTWYIIFANESQEWNMPIEYLNTLFNANSEDSIYKKQWNTIDTNPNLEYLIIQYNSQEYIIIKATREYMQEEYQSLKYSTTTFNLLNLISNICDTEWDNGTTIGTQFGAYNYVIGKYDTTVESNIISFQQGTDVSNFYVGNFNETFGKISAETSQPGATYTYYSSAQSILTGTTIISAYATNYTTDQVQTDMNCSIMFDSSVAKAIKTENQVLNTYKKQLAEKQVELEEKTKELAETTTNYENRITTLKEEIENLNEQIINGTSSLDKLLINTGAEVPMKILKSILNFDILGVNCFGLVTSILTCLVVLWLVKKFMK